MNPRVLPVAALLFCCSGDPWVHGRPETVLALAGGDVTLPCSFSIKASEDFPTVEWSKEGLKPNVVFLYRDGCETPEEKNPAFQFRTSLITKELSSGNASLRISNVQLSDAGTYRCMRLWRKAPRDITAVELVVGAVSDPKLSVLSAEGGDVTLHCAADCWQPEPQVYFLDQQGKDIGGDEPKRDWDARGCYSVGRRTTLQNRGATERVTCRVHQLDINQTRDMEILLPVVVKKSCFLTPGIAVVVVLLLAAACGSAVFCWKRFGKSAVQPNSPPPSRQSTTSGSFEDQSLLPSVRVIGADNTRNAAMEMLATQMEDLKLELQAKEDAILQFRQVHEAQLAACVCRGGAPVLRPAASTTSSSLTRGDVPQRRRWGISRQSSHPAYGAARPVDAADRRHSTPAPLDSARPLGSRVGRSMSDPRALGPGPKARLLRRHSCVFPPSAAANNHFTLLENVVEDSEMLIA